MGVYLAYNGRWPHFLARANLFEIPVLGRLLRAAEQIPVHRRSSRARDALVDADAALQRGQVIVIYPEGTRSHDGALLPFHAGSFKIAQKADAPLVVACIRGTENITKNVLRRVTDVYLDILELIPAEKVKAMSTSELARYSSELISRHLAAAAV